MPVSTTAANFMLNQWTAKTLYASLHTAYSTSGASELVGSGYTRQTVQWAFASGATQNMSNTPSFTVPTSTVEYVGYWDNATAGSFQGMTPLGGASGYAFAAPSATSTFLAPGSSYSANQTIVAFPNGGAVLPTPITAGTIYYAVTVSGDSFQMSTSSGGTAITLTGDGSGLVTAITAEAFATTGTYQLNSASWTLT